MKKTTVLLLAICALVMLPSCQKERGIDELERRAMKFYTSYIFEAATKAPSVFLSGNKATIIGYMAGAPVSSATPVAGTPLEATGGASGILSPASVLYLPKGNYDFYSVSLNSTTPAGLIFTSGISTQLVNGTDYLWSKHASVSEGGAVTFSYSHKAVGMEISVTAGTGVSDITVTSIKFTPAKPDAMSKMNLSTGAIGEAAAKDVYTSMTLNSNRGAFIMLPLASQVLNVEVTINAIIGGTPLTGKIYSATIPAQVYSGETYYTLNLTVSATSMSFTGAQIEEWASQTIGGLTLIEQ